jgi:hypothetical protein
VERTDEKAVDVDLVWTGQEAWSPWLQMQVEVAGDPLLAAPPPRSRATIGVGLADGGPFGAARVVRLRPEGPPRVGVRLGARPRHRGKRIASAEGRTGPGRQPQPTLTLEPTAAWAGYVA